MTAASIYEGQSTSIPVINANGNIFEEWQIATAGQTVFNLLTFQYTPNTDSIFVFRKSGSIGAQMLRRSVDYIETDLDTITMISGATIGDSYCFLAIGISQLIVGSGNVPPGGTTGQVLQKTSGSDYAMAWQTLSALSTLLDAVRQNVVVAATVDLTGTIATQTRNIALTVGTANLDAFSIANGQVWAVKSTTTFILGNNANITTNTGAAVAIQVGTTFFIRATADNVVELIGLSRPPTTAYAALSANVLLNNTALYFDGPSVTLGPGTWYVSGHITAIDSSGFANISMKLWDGTTIIDSNNFITPAAGFTATGSVSGFITNPTGNVKISVRDSTQTTGNLFYNNSGNGKDCSISAYRIA